MANKIKIGISACLLGKPVRYDGENGHAHFLTDAFGKDIEWVPVCPEVEFGLSVPREEMRLYGNQDSPRLITVNTTLDHTEGLKKWARKKIRDLESENLCGFIFKSKSPSCGLNGVNIYSLAGKHIGKGAGLFAEGFTKNFPLIPVESEERLYDQTIRDNFIKKVFTFFKDRRTSDVDRRP